MKHFKYVAAIAIVGSGLSMGTVDARGADRVGNDIFTPGASVCDIRGGGDVELENPGRADRDNPARGAEVNDSDCYDD